MPDRSWSGRRRVGNALVVSAMAVGLAGPMAPGGMAQGAAPVQSAPTPGSSPITQPQSGAGRAVQSEAESRASSALIRTVKKFTSAQQAFDARELATLTTPDYVEISPVGEVDSREKMLGFYAPDKKSAAPELAMSEVTVRMFGNVGVLIAKLTYEVHPPGQPARTMALRASFLAHRLSGNWKIASTQYTGIRPAAT